MRHIRVLLASMLSLFLLLGIMSWMADESYDRAAPRLQEQQERVEERQRAFDELARRDIEEMGGTAATDSPTAEAMAGMQSFVSPIRPVGTWVGVCRTDIKRIAIMKFDRDRYALVVRGGGTREETERGRYEFAYDHIAFDPDEGDGYKLDYLMTTRDCVELSGYSRFLRLERTEAVDINI
ncbi:MAG: hypothetical protein KKA42_13635 [candidate division Zixibacteria bacterium]|nr:hypothetical protein [candidate division Zixibacteria bacterium]